MMKRPGGIHDEPSLCPTCVDFMDNTIEILVDIIANGGVIGSCEELCAYLPEQWEYDVCSLLCSYVGIEAFIAVFDDVDPDPIFYCEEIDLCPISSTAAGRVDYFNVTPSAGHVGTTFLFDITFTIINTTGTGTLELDIFPPEDFPISGAALLVETPPGKYSVQWELEADPNEQESFEPGLYNCTASLCEGTCGSSHSYSYLMGIKNSSFTIVESEFGVETFKHH